MSEFRWNPLLNTWTIVAANRQSRPNMPKGYCPFCPGKDKRITDDYEVMVYPNDFPALSDGIEGVWDVSTEELYQSFAAKGACEVILYSSNHHAQLNELSDAHAIKLIELWAERFEFYRQHSLVKYVYEFENRGQEVGVTMPHPHGQLYAFPFVPLKIETELVNAQKYFEKHQRNLFEDILQKEKNEGNRVIFETDTFLVFLPYFTDYPYGIFIVSKTPNVWISEFSSTQIAELAIVIKSVNGMFDELFNRIFPYMMCIHQGAVNEERWKDQSDFYRFHIEFYPPLRAPETIKYYASTEMGAWAAANVRYVEDTAIELREAYQKFINKHHD
ncbi:MAG: galactose-1-phosphate uridylyltransferase [Chitinophagales bacterium]|nr:galactose-1-phosphate uridylyltransferase [Chitinophagales bacterium]MCZ2394715.1 galactose-1-phosphate uridylyltransferase [Chitinophagales bacterium]